MRDLASGSGSGPGEQPLPPTVTRQPAAETAQLKEEGAILPPFFPSAARPAIDSVEVVAAAASAPASSGDVSEGEFWESLEDDDAAQSVASFAPDGAENFPADAFFIPEGADHVPAGVDLSAAEHAEHRTKLDPAWIAERLEMVARRLRVEGDASLVTMRASGDELDTLIAGVLADYLATRKP